jgi:uncharacterized repeat protein (TIGR02543 family)
MNEYMNKKRVAYVLLFILIVAFFLPMVTSQSQHKRTRSPPANRGWWDPNWPYRKLITIDYTKVDGDLIGFPVLISLASDSDLAAHAQTDGDDIVFTDYNNNRLYHEIEQYLSPSGSLIAWVNVPSLSSTTDTYLYLYYGNPTTGNMERITDVWNTNFKIVQHLKETTGLHYDSTQYDNDGTATVTVQGSAVGEIDGCDEFNGVANKIDCGNKASLNMTSAITVEAWVYNHAGTVAYPRITDKFPAPSIYIRETDNLVGWYGNIGGVSCDFTFPSTTVPHNTWTYVVVTYINNATHPAKAYLNGQLKNTTKTYSGALTATTTKLHIGNRAALDRAFDGKLDEIRISNSVRNASWVKTCYNNQNSPSTFFSLGNEDAYQYTLSITINGQGSVTKDPDQTGYTYGTVVTLTADPDDGWTFDHWSGDLTGSENPTTITMNGNKDVSAYFTQNEYTLTITIDPVGGGTVDTDIAPPYHYNDIVTVTANANPGYTFDHWSGDLTGSENPTTITMNWNKSVTAHFTQNEYTLTITIDPVGKGTVDASPSPPYHYNDNVTLTAIPNTGYAFDHWSGDLTGSTNPTNIIMDGNKSVTAHFVVSEEYTLTILIEGSGSVTKNPDQSTYEYGQVVTLTANPATGWHFDHWEGDLSGNENPTTITMDENKVVTANFSAIHYTLSISIQGQGTVTKNPSQTWYVYGTVVTLTANPATYWRFDHWAGDLTGKQNPSTITMNGNKSVIANFTTTHYTLSITIQGQGAVIKNPNQAWYVYGTVVTLTANPLTGWAFNHWAGDLTGNKNPTTITMNGNKSVTANFTFGNHPPRKPDKPTGETYGKIRNEYTYTSVTTDEDGNQIYYQFNWGDGSSSEWIGPFNSGTSTSASHSYIRKGNYAIQVRAKDTNGAISEYSDPLAIIMPKDKSLIPHFSIREILEQLFDRFPNSFPLLRHMLGY